MAIMPQFKPAETQLEILKTGASEIIPETHLLEQLKKSEQSRTPLKIKFGADPSRPDIHLGHTVVINKLRTFQELGHDIQFIIGDFTALIGDPTGRNKTRPQLSAEDVAEYAKTYQDQVFKILDPAKTTVYFNSTWLSKLAPQEIVSLMARVTVQQLLVRDDFSKRHAAETPIFLHEFFYPLLQAYDSVVLKSDVELGGTDQRFNLLLGRDLQKSFGQSQQSVLIMPLLEGLDGVQKMSKSADNYIGINESPKDIFGKVMSVSDELMMRYYGLLTQKTAGDITALTKAIADGSQHPMMVKKDLAEQIVARFYDAEAGKAERDRFESVFSKGAVSDDVATVTVTPDAEGKINLVDICIENGFGASKNEIRRLMKQNAVKIDDVSVSDDMIHVKHGAKLLLKVGKLRRLFLDVN